MGFFTSSWTFFGIGAGVFVFFLIYYNKFSRTRIRMRETITNVDLFLKRQNELLTQLKDLLARFEVKPLTILPETIEAAERAISSSPIPGKAAGMSQAVSGFDGVIREVRSIPSLQRQPDFDRIIDSLERNAVELQGAQRYFNALVRENNILVETFPSALVAILLKFPKSEYLSDSPQLSKV
jgi:LemA protein